MPLPTTQNNARVYSHSSLRVSIDGQPVKGVKEISWKCSVERKPVRGTARAPYAYTAGQANFEASLTLFEDDAQTLRQRLGSGWMDRAFTIAIKLVERGKPVQTRTIICAGIKEDEGSSSDGGDALEVKYALDVLMVLVNSVAPVDDVAEMVKR